MSPESSHAAIIMFIHSILLSLVSQTEISKLDENKNLYVHEIVNYYLLFVNM